MPVVAEPTTELTPRIEIVVMPSKPGRTMMPGMVRVISSTSRAPILSSAVRSRAVTLNGTSERDCSRRCAVTTISPMAFSSEGAGGGAGQISCGKARRA